jgi:hypothetical protein
MMNSNECSRVARCLHDLEVASIDEISVATGLAHNLIRKYVDEFSQRNEVEILEDGRIEWYG